MVLGVLHAGARHGYELHRILVAHGTVYAVTVLIEGVRDRWEARAAVDGLIEELGKANIE